MHGILSSKMRRFLVVSVLAVALAGVPLPCRQSSSLANGSAQSAGTTGASVSGRVVDEDGKPIEGAAIAIVDHQTLRQGPDTAAFLKAAKTRSGKDGRYSIPIPKDQKLFSHVMIAAPRRQAGVVRVPSRSGKPGAFMGDTVLLRGSRLVGRVQDSEGAAISGARVIVKSSIEGHLSFQAFALAGGVSNAKGRFVVPCVARRGVRVTVHAPGYAAASKLVVDQSPTFRLEKTGFVRGRVVDAGGNPLEGISVNTTTVETIAWRRSTKSDAQGRFSLSVPKRGRFGLRAYESKAPYRKFLGLLLHGPSDEVVLRPIKAAEVHATEIEVSVRSRQGKKPIREFWMSAHASNPREAQSLLLYHSTRRARHGEKATLSFNPQSNPLQALVVDCARLRVQDRFDSRRQTQHRRRARA